MVAPPGVHLIPFQKVHLRCLQLLVTHAQYYHTDPLVHTQQIYSYWLACIITGIRVLEVLGILGECSGGESKEN